jgi:Tfp pilus assembly protein PilO
MTDTRKWSAIAAVLVVAIFAAGWFLLITPKHGEAASIKAKAVTQEQANAGLQQQIAVLQAQQESLPKQRAQLATFRTQIPDNPALPSLVRDLTAAGRKTGVTIDSIAPAQPSALVAAPAAAPVAAAPATGTSATGTTPNASVAAAPTRTLYQVPLMLSVTGSYFELEQFVNALEKLHRSFLVSGFTLGKASAAGSSPGDLGLVLTSRVFLSQAPPAAATTTPVAAPATATQGATP